MGCCQHYQQHESRTGVSWSDWNDTLSLPGVVKGDAARCWVRLWGPCVTSSQPVLTARASLWL